MTPPAMTPTDLAELMTAFNGVTSQLERTHGALREEVARLQRELCEANEQIERGRRLAALGEMAAGIAHEIRNPLGSIRLYATMLADDLVDRPKSQELATKIGAAVRGLDAVVGDVLAFAREMRVRPTVVDPVAAIERAIEASWIDGTRTARVTIEAGPGLACLVDEDLFHRALVNLIRNALEAMAAPPQHPGRPAVLRVCVEDVAEGVRVRLIDSGPGLSSDVIERMFNPFFTTRAAGTGLGLAIVHRIMDANAGSITARNANSDEPEGGAVIELVLPAVRAGGGGELVKVGVKSGISSRSRNSSRSASPAETQSRL